MVFSESLMIGELMAVLFIANNALPSIGSLAFSNLKLQGARIAFDRMHEFTSIKPEHDASESKKYLKNINHISIDKLSFRFPGRKKILNDISLRLQRGKMVTLLGESGGGKTTLCNILQKFYKNENGSIHVDNINFEAISITSWRSTICSMPQEIQLFNGSLVYNICLSDNQQEISKIFKFCKEYGFEQYFMKFPQQYGTLLGEEGVNISGGQKQLVALARALYQNPKILILDEPTSAMDRNTENFVLNLLQTLKKNMIIFIVSHRIKIANFSDYIYILENNTISAHGNREDLLEYDNLYSLSYRELISA